MRRAYVVPALLAVALWSTSAHAEPTAEALRLYSAGDFMAAANLASAQSTPADLNFVSRSLIAACATARSQDIGATLARAAQNAQSALALDPDSVEARINLALAYGMMGKRATLRDAFAHDYAGRGRHLIDEALVLEPNNARAHALLGAWHFEVLRRGGGLGAMAYGARVSSGMAEFMRAQSLAPNDPLISLQFAIALLQRDPTGNEALIRRLVAETIAAPVRDGLEAVAKQAAERLRLALSDGPQAAHRAARELII